MMSRKGRIPAARLRRLPPHEAVPPHRLRDLRDLGVRVPGPDGPPGGPRTLAAVYEEWCADGLRLETKADFDRLKRVRFLTAMGDVPVSDAIVVRLMRCVAPQRVTERTVGKYLGPSQIAHVLRRVAELNGEGRRSHRLAASKASVEDVLGLLPPDAAAALRVIAGEDRHPPLPPPIPNLLARTMQLEAGPLRALVAALLLQAHVDGRGYSAQSAIVAQGERMQDILPRDRHDDVGAVTAALDAYVAGQALPEDLPAVRARTAGRHHATVEAGRALAVRLGTDGAAWAVADHGEGRRFAKRWQKEGDEPRDRNRARRVARIVALAPVFGAVVEEWRARLRLVERIARDCATALGADPPTPGRAYETTFVSFPPGDEEGPVMRFRLCDERALLERALGAMPDDDELLWRTGRAPKPKRDVGLHLHAGDSSRLHLVLLGPQDEADAASEPFFVELYRDGLLEPERDMPPDAARRRKARLLALGWPIEPRWPTGFVIDDANRREVLRAWRRSGCDGSAVAIPIIPLLHATNVAVLALLMGFRSGARVGETMQLRMGADCLDLLVVDGVERAVAHLRPKAWSDPVPFPLDPECLRLLGEVRDLCIGRWFAGDDIPETRYGAYARRDVPAGRFLLRGPTSTLRPSDFADLFRLMMHGIEAACGERLGTHDARFLHATLLGLEGADLRRIGASLHHLDGSGTTAHYDLSPLLAAAAPGMAA